MGFAGFLRNFIGAAPQAEVDGARAAQESAAQAREIAQSLTTLVDEIRSGHVNGVSALRSELDRLSSRVEAMPEMRAQLETFVQALRRTMTGAADRLETVDDRIERLEQQARAQTEIIALTRGEFDRQGRVIATLDTQMKSLEEAVVRLSSVAEHSSSLMREIDQRRTRADRTDRTNRILIVALVTILVVALLR